MSIKGFHIFFITLSVLLCLFMGVEGTRLYMTGGAWEGLALAVVGYSCGLVLVAYGFRIAAKLRSL